MKNIAVKAFIGDLKVALFLAFKSITKGNRWVPILLVLVMSFSFVNVIFASSILAGVMSTMDEQLVDTVLANVIISPEEDEYYIDHVSSLEHRIRQIPGVAGVSSHLDDRAFIEYEWKEKERPTDKGKSGTWRVIGIDPQQEADVTTIHSHMIEGSYLDGDDRDEIVLGVEIAGSNSAQSASFLTLGGAKVGDKVRLTYSNGIQREYTVKGIFRAREMEQADSTAFVTRSEMASVLGRQVFFDRASQILVKAKEGVNENSLIRQLSAIGLKGEVRSWREYSGAMHSVIFTFRIIASLIGSIGLAVAAIVMFIVIYIAVVNKKREIGILRAIGIQRGVIIGSYLTQAVLYAVFGVVFGWLAVRFLLQPYFVRYPLDLPIGLVSLNVQPLTVGSSTLGLIGSAILAGFIPAWFIMKQSIIKTIWGQ